MTSAAVIPEEEWELLANAVAEPVKGLIAVEAVDSAQMAEVERRLMDLAGARPVLRQEALPGEEAPESVWQRARQLTTPTGESDTGPLPLLLVKVDAPVPTDTQDRRRLADFWRGMNQLRENWHELPAQVVFLLSPAAYEHLTLNAEHLKRWIGLKVRLWEGATDMVVLERPGRPDDMSAVQANSGLTVGDFYSVESIGPEQVHRIRERARLETLAGQYLAAAGDRPGALENQQRLDLLRRYLLPLIEGYLCLGDIDQARTWRQRIDPNWPLEPEDMEALSRLEEQLGAASSSEHPFDVFLSHNRKDQPAARALAQALRQHGLIVWLDDDELRPGLNWQRQIETGMQQSASVAILIGQDRPGPWENEEVQDALALAVNAGKQVIPVLLPDSPITPKLPRFLKYRSWVDLRPALDETNLNRLIWGITGNKPND